MDWRRGNGWWLLVEKRGKRSERRRLSIALLVKIISCTLSGRRWERLLRGNDVHLVQRRGRRNLDLGLVGGLR